MKTHINAIRGISFVVLVTFLGLSTLTGCHSGILSPLTQENLDKVQTDMSTADVKAILGEPTSSDSEPIPIVGGTKVTYVYDNNKDHVIIVFKNDKVQSKEGTFSNQ
jgi:hypothetical protein